MNPYLTFFPGKGIYQLPDGLEVLSVRKAEDARRILETFSYWKSAGVFPVAADEPVRDAARALEEYFERRNLSLGSDNDTLPVLSSFSFTTVTHTGTRSSAAADTVDWSSVERSLKDSGYVLGRRDFLQGVLDDTCPVFTLSSGEWGVIAEGKGLTEDQARKSALGEGIERLVGSGAHSEERKTLLATGKDLYRDRPWGLGSLAGPRDLYTDAVRTEWVEAKNLTRDEDCFLPKEMAYFEHISSTTATRLFSLHHTMGLASGVTFEDAALSGIFEVLERDAYWITMRCRINSPDIDLARVPDLDPKVTRIVRVLEEHGFKLHIKDMSLDWGVPIAHVILEDTNGGIPAFTHGTGASFGWNTAVARAVCEAVQMYTGLDALMNAHFKWEDVVSVSGVLGKPEFAWSDPLYREHLQHLITPSSAAWMPITSIHTVKALFERLRHMGHEVIVADLQSPFLLKVVRVHITGATQPDTRLEKISDRLKKWRDHLGLERGFYADPILT